jgi:cytochrome c556
MTSKAKSHPTAQARGGAITAAMVGLATFTTLALAHEGATGVVKERMDLMKGQQKDMKLIGDMAKGKTPFDAAKAAAAARDLGVTAKKIADLFPQGSNGHPSDAVDAIWKDWDHFTANAKDLETSADALATSLDGALDKDWKAAFGKVTDVCKSCHEDFRSKTSDHDHMEHDHQE